MKVYADIDNDSGVAQYEYGDGYIDVLFKGNNKVYRYTYQSAGASHVEAMKRLADAGEGLNSYIQRNVRDLFER
jgi:hypothetical protein